MGAVSFDQSDKEIEEKRLVARRKGRQNARVGFAYLWQQGLERQLALASEIKLTSAPISMVHTSLDKPLTLEQIGDETGVVSIDPDKVRETPLLNARHFRHYAYRGKFQLHNAAVGERFRE